MQGYDYSQAGAYFVTIVTRRKLCLFGNVRDEEVQLNTLGKLMVEVWEWLGERYPYVELDEYVVMPNHLHGIIVLTEFAESGFGPATERSAGHHHSRAAPAARRKPLGELVGAFKTVGTGRANLAQATAGRVIWQRNFYERVIRNERELGSIREYIVNNPLAWDSDQENPSTSKIPRRGASS
ncbi:MAG: transposase [Chloroflexi bacterium]|nr:transposase [Chloroflexota bacterium]